MTASGTLWPVAASPWSRSRKGVSTSSGPTSSDKVFTLRKTTIKENELNYPITTQKELRRAFWEENPDLQRHGNKPQNAYPADVRARWVEFVHYMFRSGTISEALADRATL